MLNANLTRALTFVLTGALALSVGCGKDDDDGESTPCDPADPAACADGEYCEVTVDGEPACFAPVALAGRVFDLETDEGLEGATVVAIDANGFAQSNVALTDVDGVYALNVHAERDAEGAAVGGQVTLRSDAEGYLRFPDPPRLPIPVDLATPPNEDGAIQNAATDIGLLPVLTMNDTGTIRGRIEGGPNHGALVVAVEGEVAVSTGISDIDGEFVLFNVPAGTVSVDAYRQDLAVEPQSVDVQGGEDTIDVVLQGNGESLTTVEGSLQIVNAPGGSETSVLLGLESTFNPTAVRAEGVPGLRAAPVSGDFTIEGVPPGDYVVLVAFENDDLVRDPDEGIGGTEIVHLTVTGNEGTVTLDQSFKVTEALAIIEPGADGITEVTSTSVDLVWADDSSEDGYELRIYDAYGVLVLEELAIPGVSGSDDVTYTWDGSAVMEEGGIYQFRAWSFRDRNSGRTYISATEDFRGAFSYAP